ncbi:MAG: DUF5658 family protein [Actinomycetota bacterium]|nr:DUF5658 family protein [Actinomycetota bacterium]
MTTAIAAFHRFDRRVAVDSDHALDRLRFLAIVGLVALNACDLLLTRILLDLGGTEMNPMMALVISGPWGVAIKLGVPILVGYRHLTAPLRRPLVFALCWMCVLYFAVVLWNAHFLLG